MNDSRSFRTWLDQVIATAPHTANDIPLIGAESLDLKDAQATPLIVVLADIIEATCVRTAVVPTTHVVAA
jgi:hypothetical protein